MSTLSKITCSSFVLAALATPALADDPAPATDTGATAAPTPKAELPPPTSSHDEHPPVASPEVKLPTQGVVTQAGVGGETAYGRAGVLELGGSAGLMIAPEFRDINVAPSIGFFVADNFEISGIAGLSNVKAKDSSATVWTALVEPSYHLPFNRTTFGFLGMGIGASYVNNLGTGLTVAPRLGANLLVGRSGVLSPSLSYEYTTHSSSSMNIGDMENVTVLSVSSALRINVGYTAMW